MVEPMRLDARSLEAPPPGVQAPRYRRAAMLASGGVVHLGVGAFHRAHQALYFDDLLAAGHAGFAVTGVSLRQPEVPQQLNPQDGVYSVLRLSEAAPGLRLVGSIARVLHAPSDTPAVIARMADRQTWLISTTITEKGYCHHPSSGELNRAHPDIVHDLAQPTAPRSALGFLIEALRRRWLNGDPAPVVLCCDNLPGNGRVLRGLALAMSDANPALQAWIAEHAVFPSTMVDRIVPATTDEDHRFLAERFGVRDAGLVKAEPFSQWVIESLDARLAPLATVGADLVREVAPFELMKLRLLNGSHSLLAYLGYLAGHETVGEAMAAPGFARLMDGFMREEAAPTVAPPQGYDLGAYASALLDRFRNRALAHRTWQIAMDGSQKIPQRWLGTLAERLATGQPYARLALGLAAWMQYVSGRDLRDQPIEVRDPLAARFADLAAQHPGSADFVAALFAVREVFPAAIAASPAVDAVARALTALRQTGVERCLEDCR